MKHQNLRNKFPMIILLMWLNQEFRKVKKEKHHILKKTKSCKNEHINKQKQQQQNKLLN